SYAKIFPDQERFDFCRGAQPHGGAEIVRQHLREIKEASPKDCSYLPGLPYVVSRTLNEAPRLVVPCPAYHVRGDGSRARGLYTEMPGGLGEREVFEGPLRRI